MADFATFQASTRLTFGAGAIATAGEIVCGLGVGRALVVTDPGLVKAGIVERVINVLANAGVESAVFDHVEPNPSLETVYRAMARYREAGCTGFVAVGGGSSIDVAKGAAMLASNPGALSDYVGISQAVNPLPPLLAVPTTVGSGSEVTIFAVVTDRAQHRKVVIASPLLAPRCALLDPELVLSLPVSLVASTGMDALTHAIESVISVFASAFSDGLALEAICIITTHLPRAVSSVEIEARANLLYASTMAGMAFSYARTGLVHGMAHPLGGYYDVPHGLANAILLPYVLAFDAPASEPQLTRIAAAMGEKADPQVAIEAVRRLGAAVGIPRRLSEVGVTEAFIPDMAQDAFQSSNAQLVNPRKPSLAQVVELYQQAL